MNLHPALFFGLMALVIRSDQPAMIWYFREEPHVHTWGHIRQPT
ncbi:MAG: hypothetical protein VB877_15970 [Pirellulaceae bacterium]